MNDNNNPNEKYGMPTSYNHKLIEQALGYGDSAIAAQRQAATNSVNAVEQSMYDILGRQQLQTEKDIIQRRMQATRSGMSSGQLAALELQNIQTSQIGAQQMAQQYDMQRQELMREYAGAEDVNRQYMMEMLNQNMGNAAAIDAQRLQFDVGAQFKGMFGEEAYNSLDAAEKANLALMFSGQEISKDDRNRILGKLTGQKTGNSSDASFDKEEFFNNVQATYSDYEFEDEVIDVETMSSSELGIGYRSGASGSNQTKHINEIKRKILDGEIKDGEVIDLNYGWNLGDKEHYIVHKGKLIRIKREGSGSESSFNAFVPPSL